MSDPLVYADDPDASWVFTVTDGDGQDLDWASPVVAVGSADYTLTATWLGDPAPTRKLKVPLDTLTTGSDTLYLRVPGANDIKLGRVRVEDRR